MEADGREPPEVEVLDTERPPSAFQLWVRSVLRRPAARVAVVVAVTLVLVGVWTTLPGDEPAPEAEAVVATDPPPGLRPPPPRGRVSPTGDWQVQENTIVVTSGPKGPTVSFLATNNGTEGRDPGDLEVTADFVDRPGSVYRAGCSGFERTPRGYRPLRGAVKPQDFVLVRCESSTRHRPQTPTIDFDTVEVRRIPCESEQSSLPM